MADGRPRSYLTAITALRERLKTGRYPAGQRITAVEAADELRLSATPVREALSRLAGEGLLEERRGQGYFVRVLAAEDVADLFRLSLAHLLIALDAERDRGRTRPALRPAAGAADPVEEVESLFMEWVVRSGSPALVRAQGLVQLQLAPLRRLEPDLIVDLDQEAASLRRAREGESRLRALRLFHGRRIALSARLAQAWLARAGQEPRI